MLLKIISNLSSRLHPMFIGRESELQSLGSIASKSTARLVVISGRRRIGKSTLVREFAKTQNRFLEFSGLPPNKKTTKQDQLDEFVRQLSSQTQLPRVKVSDWGDAFQLLAKEIHSAQVLILLDEISWMGSKDHTFLGKLKNAWDLYFKLNNNLTLIICGSVSSWIEKNILSSTGFLGRISLELYVQELPLHLCNEFWGPYKDRISSYEKLKLLAITGGIPRYLEEIEPQHSAEQNIQRLCFEKHGVLYNEFNRIFSDLFNEQYQHYRDLISELVNGPLTLSEIYTQLNKAKNVSITESLETLARSGFVSRDYTWNLKGRSISKLSKFRISDNYVRFYLKHIAPHQHLIEKGLFEFKELNLLPGWLSIMGLQFEQLVMNNFKTLHEQLSIDPVEVLSSNPFFQTKTKTRAACQIDYLIHSRFDTLYVCEIKFSRKAVGVEVIKEVEEKTTKLVRPKGFSIRPVLVTVGEVTDELRASQYFDKIIYFEDMLCHAQKQKG